MVCRVGMRRLLALGGRKFSLTAFMFGQSDGFYYDFTRTDRHFQEYTGQTLADDIGEAIGLALDQRTWGGASLSGALGPELVPDPTFGSASGLTVQAYWTIADGVATRITGASGTAIYPTGSLVAVGGLYRVRYQITNIAAGSCIAGVGSVGGISRATSGSFEEYILATVANGFPTASGMLLYGTPTFAGSVDDWSVKWVPGYSALQATGAAKPTRQTSGAKFDGSDDNLLTTYYATSGANFIAASVSVPATLSAVQVIAGASGSGANRTFLAIDTSGRVCAGVGSDSTTVHVGTTDLRGTDAVIALSYDGTTVRLFAGSTLEYSGPQASTPTTTIPYRIGSLNSNGTAASFSAAAIKRIVVGREFLTTPQFAQLAPALRG